MLLYLFRLTVLLICVYTVRHYWFTLTRLFGRQRHPFVDLENAAWPAVTVLIAAHNEEAVISDIVKALLEVDYPRERLQIIPFNDRGSPPVRGKGSTKGCSAMNASMISRVRSVERGKAAALKGAMEGSGRALIRRLVAPFLDSEIGAVMGRVVPRNVSRKSLTCLLDLVRSGGY